MQEAKFINASSEDLIANAVEKALRTQGGRPCDSLCGSQGSGKSTLTAALSDRFGGAPVISMDDLYLPRHERQALAQQIHPLLLTRGVPGTHDVALSSRVMEGLRNREFLHLPRFDKSADDRTPEEDWPPADQSCSVVFLEGWCLGPRPQTEAELASSINRLERVEDPDGRWWSFVNLQLSQQYHALFSHIDLLVFLAAPHSKSSTLGAASRNWLWAVLPLAPGW